MSENLTRRIEALLPLVSKPTRYLGNEFHVRQRDAEPNAVEWCLIHPEVYEIGMSHWGLRILYDILNNHAGSRAERAYAPWFDMEARMRAAGVPLFSLETKRALRDFDVVGFTLQYELTYTNLLNCLDLGGIPLRSGDRGPDDPLVAAGGPCASNPEPLAEFIDFFLIGDAEEAVIELTETIRRLRGRPRGEILAELAQIPGVYVPGLYKPEFTADGRLAGVNPVGPSVPQRVQRRFVRDLETAHWPEIPIVPLQGIVQDRLSVEVLRGCTHGCRFCQAGYFYRPVRERSAARVLELADKGIRASGWSEVGLVSLSTADHTQVRQIAELLNTRFRQERVGISLPSLRADSFSLDLAQLVGETKKSGFTFAPEAGTERLRRVLNKNISDAGILEAANAAYSRGWRLIKLYFMVGLPTERREDIEAIPPLVDEIRRIGRRHGPSCAVNVSVGAFVPKSHTPFQWEAFEETGILREKIDYLAQRIRSRWTRVKRHHVEASHLEAVFSMGDRRLGAVLEAAFRAGARFDGWTEHFDYGLWMRCFEEQGLDPGIFTRARGVDEALPWDAVDIGVDRSWLAAERKRAAGAGMSEAADEAADGGEDGLLPDCRFGMCQGCGIEGMPHDIRLAPVLTDEAFKQLKQALAAQAPRMQAAGITWPVRLVFEKRGLSRFLSHLETTAVLGRAFRAARVPVAYTQGHKPHPKLSFGPPLPVGVDGAAEMIDAELHEPWSDNLAARLNEVLPAGIRILRGRSLPAVPGLRRTSLQAAAVRAEYRLDLAGLPREMRERIGGKLREFGAADAMVVERSAWNPDSGREWDAESVEGGGQESGPEPDRGQRSERARDGGQRSKRARDGGQERRGDRHAGAVRTVDLKQAIASLEALYKPASAAGAQEDAGLTPATEAQDAAGLPPAELRLELHLVHASGQTANPRIVLEKLFGLSPEEQALVGVIRMRLMQEDGTEPG